MGLKTGTVKIEKYNKTWPKEFEQEKGILQKVFGNVAITIEHIGSTSIEGLSAKPIIDIAVGLNELSDFEGVRNKFLSKEYSISKENAEGEILVVKDSSEWTTHLIHVMKYDSARYKNTIVFRDYLRNNPEYKIEYENLKKQLAEKYKYNRKMYTASKNDFIQNILKKAAADGDKIK